MFCTRCGAKMPDGARFCTECGAPMDDDEPIEQGDATATTPFEQATQAQAPLPAYAPQPETAPATKPEPQRADHRGRNVLIAVLAALCVLVVAFFIYKVKAPHAVVLNLDVPGLSTSSSRIPVRVTGMALDGESVDEVFFVGPNGDGIQLKQGTYRLSVIASPILEDGTIFLVSDAWQDFSFGRDLSFPALVADAFAQTVPLHEVTITLVPESAVSVTDEQIDNAYEEVLADPERKDSADGLRETATETRDDAVAAAEQRIADEEAAEQQRAADEAAESAAAAQARRETLAHDFAMQYWTNVTVSSPDASGHEAISDWSSRCLAYVEPGTSLYEDFSTGRDGGAGDLEAIDIAKDAEVTSSEGNTVHVTVNVAGGMEDESAGWSRTANFTYTMDVTFADDDLITSYASHYTDPSTGRVTTVTH